MKFAPPKPEDFEDKPHVQLTRKDGSILRAYKHKTEHGRLRVTIDDKPYDPTSRFMDAIEKGLIKKK